jgi:hypothetical protein
MIEIQGREGILGVVDTLSNPWWSTKAVMTVSSIKRRLVAAGGRAAILPPSVSYNGGIQRLGY